MVATSHGSRIALTGTDPKEFPIIPNMAIINQSHGNDMTYCHVRFFFFAWQQFKLSQISLSESSMAGVELNSCKDLPLRLITGFFRLNGEKSGKYLLQKNQGTCGILRHRAVTSELALIRKSFRECCCFLPVCPSPDSLH